MDKVTWVYIKSEPCLWTVGFYDPSGRWQTDSDHDTKDSAANRVHWLNGGIGREDDGSYDEYLWRYYPDKYKTRHGG